MVSGYAKVVVVLVTSGQIAEILGVSRPRVHKLAARPGFPQPAEHAGRYRLWRLADIEAWAETWDRGNVGGRPKQKPPPRSI